MRRLGSWLLFFLCVAVFLTLRFFQHDSSESVEILKPNVPAINLEKERDQTALAEVCEAISLAQNGLSPDQIREAILQKMRSLQTQVPFALPTHLYNVVCIPETSPYHIYQRLYLGESEVGFPFYLDVRVFELGDDTADALMERHLQTLDGETLSLYQDRACYIKKGFRTQDTAHGFAKGERGLFIDSIEEEGRLFVLYAEGPLATFEKHVDLFKKISKGDL